MYNLSMGIMARPAHTLAATLKHAAKLPILRFTPAVERIKSLLSTNTYNREANCSVLDNLRLQYKLLLIAAIAVVPSVVLLVLLIVEKNIAIDFSHKEVVGNQYLRPLRQIQERLPDYEDTVLGVQRVVLRTGDEGSDFTPAVRARFIDQALTELERIDLENGRLIGIEPRLVAFRERWERIRQPKDNERGRSVFAESMEELRLDLRRMIAFVGDDSNLILDPDLDTYYMMDATLLKLPSIQDQLTAIAARCRAALRQSTISTEDRTLLLASLGTLEATLEELSRNMATGFQNNKARNLQPKLTPYLDEFRTGCLRLTGYVRRQLLDVERPTDLDPADFEALLHDARRSGFRLWDITIVELDTLLMIRIDGFRERKLQAILGVILVLLVSSLLVYNVSLRVSSRVNRLAQLARAIATKPEDEGSTARHLKAMVSRDEVGALSEAVLSMSEHIRRYICDLRSSQASLEEANATLEQRVADRTQEIARKNLELEDALKLVREAQNRLVTQEKLASLGSLTAGIAHEIKNPLNFVNNFAQLTTELTVEIREVLAKVADRLEPADHDDLLDLLGMMEQNVQKINEHGQRADSIVKGMLAHSRGKVGEPQPVDLNALVMEYAKLAYHGLRAQDPTFNVALEFELDSAVGQVPLIPQDFSRAVLNIVNNGCYSAHQKRKEQGNGFAPEIRVRTRSLGEKVEVRLRDNGLGISREKLQKIFEPFYTTKPTGQGTGLGLSMTYDIVVQQHGGELTVESEEGDYAEFIITLPRQHKGA